MSPAGSKPLDVDRLCEAQAEIDHSVRLEQLPRLAASFPDISGEAVTRIRFGRVLGHPSAHLSISGTARLTCQRCMGPLELPFASEADVGLVSDETAVNRVPAHLEPMLTPGGRTSAAELAEEELLLALPIVPLHAADDERCVAIPEEPEADADVTRPFARLGELLKDREPGPGGPRSN